MNFSQINMQAAGEIRWKDDFGKRHTAWFAKAVDPWAVSQGLEYCIAFPNTRAVRFAKILKTVVHVAVDEAADGSPVFDKWNCKATFYPTNS